MPNETLEQLEALLGEYNHTLTQVANVLNAKPGSKIDLSSMWRFDRVIKTLIAAVPSLIRRVRDLESRLEPSTLDTGASGEPRPVERIEVLTLHQSISSSSAHADLELAAALSDGWEKFDVAVTETIQEGWFHVRRVVTLIRRTTAPIEVSAQPESAVVEFVCPHNDPDLPPCDECLAGLGMTEEGEPEPRTVNGVRYATWTREMNSTLGAYAWGMTNMETGLGVGGFADSVEEASSAINDAIADDQGGATS